jgi:hypothetical protein
MPEVLTLAVCHRRIQGHGLRFADSAEEVPA